MPEITFILPHWIYWGGILLVPALLYAAARYYPRREVAERRSLRVAFLLLVCGGFMGLHRLYIKSWGALIFIVLFVAVIVCNQEARLTRNDHSLARNDVNITQYDLERAEYDELTDDEIAELETRLAAYQKVERALAAKMQGWHDNSRAIAIIVFFLLLLELYLLPRALRRANPPQRGAAVATNSALSDKPTADGGRGFSGWVAKLNERIGELVSYWTVIAVFVFYYEVIARYVFNSPTIWAHESMYLMFGMQYLLAGGFCLREDAHVRVDVLYIHLSARGKAVADVCTSGFFFIFATALMVTGWIFFHDSFLIREASFTEWAIPHWPIKFALPLGGALILLQGLASFIRDVETLRQHKRASLS